MTRFLIRQAAHLLVGLIGALLIAAALSALAEPRQPGLPSYLAAFVSRLWHFARLDLGQSAMTGLTVADELAGKLPPTLELVGMGAGVALIAGLPLGVLFAFGSARRIAAPLLQVLTATPVFCASLALAYGAAHLRGAVLVPGLDQAASDQTIQFTVLPVLTVGLAGAAAVQLTLRRAAARSSGEAFRTGLRRLGLGPFEIERVFALPQVLAGFVDGVGEIVLALLSAAVVAEWVFHRPGAADLFVKSVALADWNMAAMILLAFAALTFVVVLLGKIAGFILANEGRT